MRTTFQASRLRSSALMSQAPGSGWCRPIPWRAEVGEAMVLAVRGDPLDDRALDGH
jgi:hypothetical protein